MSRENVETVRAVFKGYLSGDEAAVRELAAPDIVISMRPDQPDARDHKGYAGMLQMSAEWIEAWDEHALETVRVWDAGDVVFVVARETWRGRLSGIPMEHDSTFVCTVRDGRLVRMQIFGSTRSA